MRYESFSLRLEPGSAGAPAVSVRSPQGEGKGTFEVPRAGDPAWRGLEAGQDRGAHRHVALSFAAPAAPVLDAGKELFRALFREEAASLFHASLGGLRGERQGLRIDIAIDPRSPEVASLQKLPWELLCRPETEDFLCLSRRTPVVRSLEAHRERRPAIPRPGRLRILVVAASPMDHPSLALERERKNLEEAWKGQERKVETVFLERGGLEAMRQALLAAPFHILHFMGHGELHEESGRGSLVFERDDGTGQRFEGRRLAQLLYDFKTLRLVVLNACHTSDSVGSDGPNPFDGVASSLVMGGMPAVVAMSGPVSDLAAVAFSRTLYQRLAAGDPVEAAVTEGRLAIQRADPGELAWAIPTLFLRSADGMLFASPSTVWARRAALLAGIAVALALILILASGWLNERRAAQVVRLTNDGIGFLALGRIEEARTSFRSALAIDPDNSATLGNLSVVEMQLGDDEGALVHAREAVRSAPQEAIHHYNLGNLLALKKRYEEALASLQQALEIDPCYAYAYNEIGNVYLDLDHPAEARKAFQVGLACEPTLGKLHKNLARTALSEGNPEEAISHLERALPLYLPSDPAGKAEAVYWMAAALTAAGRADDACEALRDLEFLDPRRLNPLAQEAARLAEQQRCAS